jgi:hypothetical protein
MLRTNVRLFEIEREMHAMWCTAVIIIISRRAACFHEHAPLLLVLHHQHLLSCQTLLMSWCGTRRFFSQGMEDEGWEIEEELLADQEQMLPPMDGAGHNYLPHPKVAQMMGQIGVQQELYFAAGNSARMGQGGVYQGKLGSPGGRRNHEAAHATGDGQNYG